MKCIIGVLLLVAFVWGDDKLFQNIPSVSIADIENSVKETCETNGGKNAFSNLKDSVADLVNFAKSHFDIDEIQKEIEKSSKAGALDEVFKKYCDLRSQSLDHIHKIGDSVVTCLTEEERPVFKLVVNITGSLLNFACEKDGERVALFIAEGGVECISSKSDALQKCANDIMANKVPPNFDKIPKLTVSKEDCNDYKTIQGCVVKALGECSNSTPSDIVDALLNYIYKLSNCSTLA